MYDRVNNIRWDPTITAQERIDVMIQYRLEHPSVRTFVETGTANGDTCYALQEYFDELYTIEIAKSLFKATKQRLQPIANITCMLGDSSELLPELLRRVNKSCLFWLDGHYSGNPEGRGRKDTPIAEELEIIFATGIPHVILIDDARLFGTDPVYPSVDWVRRIATSQDIPYSFSYSEDIMRVVPARSVQ